MTVPSLEVVPDASAQDRWHLSLAGEWTCALDPDGVGEREQWFRTEWRARTGRAPHPQAA